MKIYRAVLRYNNGDYNEWEEMYDVTSKWYTSKEEAEKHFPEMAALADWLRYKHRNNTHFYAGDPKIEEGEILDEFKPIHNFKLYSGDIAFNASEFSYINETPSLEIGEIEYCTNLDNSIGSWNYKVKVGPELFTVHFSTYTDDDDPEPYIIEPYGDEDENDNSHKSKYWLYSPEVKEKFFDVIKKNIIVALLPIFEKSRHAWDAWHEECDKKDGDTSVWHTCRLEELKLTIEGIDTAGAYLSEYAYGTLTRRKDDILTRIMDRPEEAKAYEKELSFLEEVINNLNS